MHEYGHEAALYDRDYGARITGGTSPFRFKRFPIEFHTPLDEFKTF